MRILFRKLWTVLQTLLLLTLAGIAHGGEVTDSVMEVSEAVFTDVERKLIRDYYRNNDARRSTYEHHHPGKAKKDKSHKNGHKGLQGLPPGIAMKVQRGGELPPGIAKKHLPYELEHRLPRRERYRRMELDTQVVLVDIASDIIVDVIDKVFD